MMALAGHHRLECESGLIGGQIAAGEKDADGGGEVAGRGWPREFRRAGRKRGQAGCRIIGHGVRVSQVVRSIAGRTRADAALWPGLRVRTRTGAALWPGLGMRPRAGASLWPGLG